MKILLVHNSYQIKGGEDTVVANELKMLESHGHEVIQYIRNNREIESYSLLKKLGLLASSSFSKSTYQELADLLLKHQPDVCHVHNFQPLITPSVFYACQAAKVPVIQTLHNYRLACINGMFVRNGEVCEDCLSAKNRMIGVKHKCFRNSHLQSYAAARSFTLHEKKGTWSSQVDRYLCLTEFARRKFIELGIPEEKLAVKPNFVELPKLETQVESERPRFLFLGRLEKAKGIYTYLQLARALPELEFIAIGKNVEQIDFDNEAVRYLGEMPYEKALAHLQSSTALIFPSIWYEGMPMTIIEAFALNTPVIASDLGAMRTMIEHEKTGLLFSPGDVQSLQENVDNFARQIGMQKSIATNARKEFENNYSMQANYVQLMDNYQSVIANYESS